MLTAPEVERHWALFLDLDGTLLDIAAAPDEVVTPSRLTDALARVSAALGGALAVVSGRSLDEVDRLLSPLHLPVAAEHGALIRLPSGALETIPAARRPPPSGSSSFAMRRALGAAFWSRKKPILSRFTIG